MQDTSLSPDAVSALFTRTDGQFLFARWGRPIVPVIFGVTEETIPVLKGAIEAVVALADHKMAETDPELGANLMVFFVRDWSELTETPNLDRMIPDLGPLVDRLQTVGANQYRIFRFDEDGGIKACFVFLRMDAQLASLDAETLALTQMVQSVLLWSDAAFTEQSALAKTPGGRVVLRPEIGALIRAAYDPVLPPASEDASHALRLFARMAAAQ
ncbi:hypothetical protein [Meridianimarinicoccus aquatilis]|uniref:Uncharacterized protein n=1 Tax=Meridianimarinicoccus aquatilis TaxID=2552766 RepID=A0A4V3BBR5_9RHOB|nr:hypothetical protein [Fluviibacterium aquatile]QIE40662.1 hypothetical protein G5B39_00970 [Rhodobacteraceae bacterium SC52]TDL87889.1 hypothetical protein E2L05_10495 [Fluviibacterium aquatile]